MNSFVFTRVFHVYRYNFRPGKKLEGTTGKTISNETFLKKNTDGEGVA